MHLATRSSGVSEVGKATGPKSGFYTTYCCVSSTAKLAFTATAIDGAVASFEGYATIPTLYGHVTYGTQFRYDQVYGCIGRFGNYNPNSQRLYPEGDGRWYVWLC